MLKLSDQTVGSAFFGIVAGLLAGVCLGLGAWWPAGILLAAAVACLYWACRTAMLIGVTLAKFLDRAEEMPRTGPPKPRPKPRPRRRGGKDKVN